MTKLIDASLESRLWTLLEKEGLGDLSQFHRPGFSDEVPLYSRLADISFLSSLPKKEANAALLRFALKYLMSVISYEEHREPYFAAITVWNISEDDPVVPNLFVWSDPVGDLYDHLTLIAAKSAFGKELKRAVSQLRMPEPFEVREDTATTPEMPRVFIGPARSPYQCFVPLFMFHKSAVSPVTSGGKPGKSRRSESVKHSS